MDNLNKNENYKLITSNSGKIYTIDNKDWETDELQFTINVNNQIPSFTYFSKLTQINTGQYVFLDNECNLNICDSNFFNVTNLGKFNIDGVEVNIRAIEQLSNYQFLVSDDNASYLVESINIFPLKINKITDKKFISIKQIGYGKVIVVESDNIFCGNIFTYDFNGYDKIENREPLVLEGAPTDTIAAAIYKPDYSNFLIK